jgi:hypothetical protein
MDDTNPEAPRRLVRPVRWYHVAVLALAVLVCSAAVGFAVTQSSDRDDATAARTKARTVLATQRRATASSAADLAATHDDTKAALDGVGPVTTSLHELTDLVVSEVDTLANSYQAALAADVNQYNSFVGQGNDLLHQIQAKRELLEQQIDVLRQETEAQFAAATSSR